MHGSPLKSENVDIYLYLYSWGGMEGSNVFIFCVSIMLLFFIFLITKILKFICQNKTVSMWSTDSLSESFFYLVSISMLFSLATYTYTYKIIIFYFSFIWINKLKNQRPEFIHIGVLFCKFLIPIKTISKCHDFLCVRWGNDIVHI